MLNLRHIEIFNAIMRTGSMTGAGRLLNVTQPAVSVALKQLEARLHLKLFDRAGGRLQPTSNARALLPDVAEIFGRVGAIERLSQDLAQGHRGVFTIAATPPLGDGFVAKAVATFITQRPNVKIDLQSVTSATALDRVIRREADIGVVYEPIVSSAVDVAELSRAQIGCILPARHRLARKRSLSIADLSPYPVITYLPQALLRTYIDRALSDSKMALNVVAETGTSATAIMLAVHGTGIALVETALFLARPIPGFVSRPLHPRIELKVLLLEPRVATPSQALTDFIAHLGRAFP